MILRKTILAIVMLLTVMANCTAVEAVETTPYVYYGTIGSFIENINYVLDLSEEGKNSNYKLYNPKYQQRIGGDFIGEVTISTGSDIKFFSTLNDSAIYKIEIHSTNIEVLDKIVIIDAATILATGVPVDIFDQFRGSLQKWINSLNTLPLPTSKTFQLWNNQLKRYIVVKWEVNKGDLKIKIYGQFS